MAAFARMGTRGRLLAIALLWPAAAGASEVIKFTHQGVERTAVLMMPAPAPASPAPLVVALHGLGGSAEDFAGWRLFEKLANREGLVTLYPSALDGRWSYGRPIIQPMPTVGGETVDDVGFLRLAIDVLIARKIADPARVYLIGPSRGGLMAFTAACALAGRLAAVAALITPMTQYQREDCRPTRPVPIIMIAGTRDPAQPFAGASYALGRLLSIPDTMNFWRLQHGCTQPSVRPLPHRDLADATRVTVVEWSDCRSGASPLLYRVEGGGHQLPSLSARPMSEDRFGPRNRDIETADEVWAFFKRFRL